MKKTFLFILACCALLGHVNNAKAQAIPRDEAVEAQVEALLAKMSLDDKVGQMCELCLDVVTDNSVKDHFQLSEPAMQKTFGQYKVGSILNIPNSKAATPEVWTKTIRTLNSRSADACNGIPQLHGVDQIHGASYTMGGTLFPQEVGVGASFNRSIPRRIGEISAYETRACLIPWVYSPVMDLGRNPLWPRQWESFGEDVLLNAEMAVQMVKGYQGDDPNHIGKQNVAACLKHYLAYGVPVSGKDRTPSSVSYREMKEKYFLPFKACIEAGALSIMVNSANNSGVPFHANKRLLTEWLKEGLNWDGMIVTDWADIDNLYKRDHVAADKKGAIEMAINAGIDMSMDPYDLEFCTLLKELVNEGRVPMSRIDDAVRRILRLKIRIGLMDRKTWDIDTKKLAKAYPDFASKKFADEAVKMAEECMVLLKNDKNILPLAQGTKILCVGPNADNFRPMNGGWTYTWQGDQTDAICRSLGKYKTFYAALSDKFGKDNVTYNGWLTYKGRNWQDEEKDDLQIEACKNQAAQCDVIIAFIGENSYTETVGNFDDLTLSANQIRMVKHLSIFNKPIILVLNEGRPRLITEIEPKASAVVHTFLPGNYGGEALANLLSGESNFSGKMPMTYPKHSGSFATYDHKPCENMATMDGAYNYDAKMDVLYTFGQGMSYTTFAYSNLRLAEGNEVSKDATLTFSVDVTNTGKVAGKEPVLLYISDIIATLTPDVKRLRAFDKVELQPGETKTVTLSVKAQDLAFVNEDLEWVLEPGEFRAAIGNQSIKFYVK